MQKYNEYLSYKHILADILIDKREKRKRRVEIEFHLQVTSLDSHHKYFFPSVDRIP